MTRVTYLPSGFVVDSGTVTGATSDPGTPSITAINPSEYGAVISIAPPTTLGGGFLSGFTLQILNSGVVEQTISNIDATATVVAVASLAASTPYTASLTASNTFGDSSAVTQTFTTEGSSAAWDPSAVGPSSPYPGGIFDAIVGPTASPSAMTFIAKGTSILNGAVVQPGTSGATVLGANPNVGPGNPLYTSKDGSNNSILNEVKLDSSLQYLQATGGSATDPGTLIQNSILQTSVLGASGAWIKLMNTLLAPGLAAAQAAGGGAAMHNNITMGYTDVSAPTDCWDPASGSTAVYSRFQEQKPSPIDGKPFNGLPPSYFNNGGSHVNGYYYNNPGRTDASATAASGATQVTDGAITYGDMGAPIQSGGGIPVGAFVGPLIGLPAGKKPGPTTKGSGFNLVDWNGNPLATNGTVAGITLVSTPVSTTTTVSIAKSATTVTDSTIQWFHQGQQLTDPAGLGLPLNGIFVGHVTPGVSYNIVDSTGTAYPTNAAMTSITRNQNLATPDGYAFPTQLQDYAAYKTTYTALAGGEAGVLGNTSGPGGTALPTFAQVRMHDYQASSAHTSISNAFLLQCVVEGAVDSAGTISGANSLGYNAYPTSSATYNGTKTQPQGAGPFFTVTNGVASELSFTLHTDGTVNLTALASSAAGLAVWVNLGGFPHADGIQMLAGQGLFVDHCVFLNLDVDDYFIEPSVVADGVISNDHCRQSYLEGGPLWWFNVDFHNGPLNFNKPNMMGGLYPDPTTGTWKNFIHNQVLIDTTNASGQGANTQVTTNINGTRPRGSRWVENVLGPLSDGTTYPKGLSGNDCMIYSNAGTMIGSDAQYIKGVQNQYGSIFSADTITTSAALNAGTAYSTISFSGTLTHALAPGDVIFVVEPQNGNGQSASRMFVVGPSTVSTSASSINVVSTEGTSVNTGTFPVINTTPATVLGSGTMASGANIYTPYTDVGAIVGWSFDWHGFERMMNANALLSKAVAVGNTTIYVDALPGSGTYPSGAALPGYTPNIGVDTITVVSSTPSSTPSATPPPSQTFTISGAITSTGSGWAIPVSAASTIAAKTSSTVFFNAYTPTWHGNAIALSQSTLNTRYGGGSGYMGMGSSDARTWIRAWGNVIKTANGAPIVNPGKVNSNTSYGPTSGNYTGYDVNGLYIGV